MILSGLVLLVVLQCICLVVHTNDVVRDILGGNCLVVPNNEPPSTSSVPVPVPTVQLRLSHSHFAQSDRTRS